MVSNPLISLFLIWASSLALHFVYYVIATGIVLITLRLFWHRGLNRRKIQHKAWSRADALREIAASLRTVVIFALITTAVRLGAASGLFSIRKHFDGSEIAYLLCTLVAMILAQDTYFYWTHRLMHHRLLFRTFHRTHHKSVTSTVFAAYAFDAPEAFVHGLFVPLWLLIIPMHQLGILIFLAFMVGRNATGHCGVELCSIQLAASGWFGWFSPTAHHDLHHTTVKYNYGLYFTWWDRLMGTEHPKYCEQLRLLSGEACIPMTTPSPAGISNDQNIKHVCHSSVLLQDQFPDRYHRVPMAAAWSKLWSNPILLSPKGDHSLILAVGKIPRKRDVVNLLAVAVGAQAGVITAMLWHFVL